MKQIVIFLCDYFEPISGYIIAGLSFSLIFNTFRFYNFVHAGFFLVGLYSFYIFVEEWEFPFLASLIASLIVTSMSGLLSYLFLVKPLLKKRLNQQSLLLATYGLYLIFWNVFTIFFGSASKSVTTIRLASFTVEPDSRLPAILINIIFSIFVMLVIKHLDYDKYLRAMSEDLFSAISIGINVEKVTMVAYILAALLACVYGFTVTDYVSGIAPLNAFGFLINGIVIATLAGPFIIRGTIVWSTALGVIEKGFAWMTGNSFVSKGFFGLMVLLLILVALPKKFDSQTKTTEKL